MRLAAGEIDQRRPIAFVRHDANVDLQARAKRRGGSGRPCRNDFLDFWEASEPIDDRLAAARRDDHVEIAHGFLAPAKAAGDFGFFEPRRTGEMRKRRIRIALNRCELEPPFLFQIGGGEAMEQRFLEFGAKARERTDFPGSRRASHVIESPNAECVAKAHRALGPDVRKPHQLKREGRDCGGELFELGVASGAGHFGDLPREILADSRKLVELLASPQHLGDFDCEPAQDPGGVAIGANPERIVAFKLTDVGDFFEDAGDVLVARQDW